MEWQKAICGVTTYCHWQRKKEPLCVCVWVFTTSDLSGSNYSPLFIRSFVSLIIKLCFIPQWECTQWGHVRRKWHLSCSIIVKVSHSVVSDSLWPHGLYSAWNFPGQNTRVGSLSLLHWIFPNQGSNQVSCIAGWLFTSWARREALLHNKDSHYQMNQVDYMTLILLTLYSQLVVFCLSETEKIEIGV